MEENPDESLDQKTTRELLQDNGFVILDVETDERLSGWFSLQIREIPLYFQWAVMNC